MALALILLISSGLMIRTLQSLKQVQPGFTHPDQVLTLRISIRKRRSPTRNGWFVRISEMLRKLFGNARRCDDRSFELNHHGWSISNDPIFVEDRTYSEGQIPPLRRSNSSLPDSFSTMGNPLLAGRDVTWDGYLWKTSCGSCFGKLRP